MYVRTPCPKKQNRIVRHKKYSCQILYLTRPALKCRQAKKEYVKNQYDGDNSAPSRLF